MRILGYKGTSLTSHAIKLQTRSKYSHIGVQLADGSVIEAWAEGFFKGSVRRIKNPFIKHADNTLIDVYNLHSDVIGDFDAEHAEDYLIRQIGQKYDYSSVIRFVTRKRQTTDNDKKFCSELAELAFIEGGVRLLNGNPSEHSPRDTLLSPYLVFQETIWKDK